MNEKEKKEFYIAMCRCCLIAEAMKSCSVCCFNVGLTPQVKPAAPISLPISVQGTIFAVSERSEFNSVSK